RKRAHAWRKKRIGNQARCELAEKGHLISTKETKITKMEFDGLSQSVIGCAIEVHRTLGPGLLESTYRQCLACELSHAQIPFQMEVPPTSALQRCSAGLRLSNRSACQRRAHRGGQIR